MEDELTKEEYARRKAALVYYELCGYSAQYADEWAVDGYGSGSPEEFEKIVDGLIDVWPAERKMARVEALYEYTRKQFTSEKDVRAIRYLGDLVKELTEAEREYTGELNIRLSDGGIVDIFAGSDQAQEDGGNG